MKWLLILTLLYLPARAVFINNLSEAQHCKETAGLYDLEITWELDTVRHIFRTTTGKFKCECYKEIADERQCLILLR